MINLSEFKKSFNVTFEPTEDMKSLIGEIKDDKMFGILLQKVFNNIYYILKNR